METTKNNLSKVLNVALWTAQVVLAGMFFMFGQMKLFTPMDQLNVLIPWTNDVPAWLTRFIATSELLGSVGLILPAVLRIKPVLTPLAACGIALIMILAILFHIARGESQVIGFHIGIIALASFIVWGRLKKKPIRSRSKRAE